MKYLVWGLFTLLVVVRNDFWFRSDEPLVMFGFVPTALLYQIGITLAAVLLWVLAARFCWPGNLQESTSEDQRSEAGS